MRQRRLSEPFRKTAHLLILEDLPFDNVKRVEELGVLVKPEVVKRLLGDALLALEAASDADAVGAERHYVVWMVCRREETVGGT